MSYEFGVHLKQCGIVSQLTPPGTPKRNCVSKHHNHTLLDMVQSMMSLTDLPQNDSGKSVRDIIEHTISKKYGYDVWTHQYDVVSHVA